MKVKYIDRSFGVDGTSGMNGTSGTNGTNGTRWRDVARRVWGCRLEA